MLGAGKSHRKKEWVACKLEERCALSDSLKETRTRDGDRSYSKVACWGWDFYELRNAIAHGDKVEPERLKCSTANRPWLTQLIVADLVFWQCVTCELYALNCMDDTARRARKLADIYKTVFPDLDAEPFTAHVAASFLGFSEVHRALGWLPWKESKA